MCSRFLHCACPFRKTGAHFSGTCARWTLSAGGHRILQNATYCIVISRLAIMPNSAPTIMSRTLVVKMLWNAAVNVCGFLSMVRYTTRVLPGVILFRP
jgi:hypothetical protein